MDPTTAALAEQAGTIASRFESQSSIDEAKERKDAEWQAAYARYVLVAVIRVILKPQTCPAEHIAD
jgi:hypothetical protein